MTCIGARIDATTASGGVFSCWVLAFYQLYGSVKEFWVAALLLFWTSETSVLIYADDLYTMKNIEMAG